ncbi:MAG: TonB-dependent receptor [Gammaproteobacteria bacterium]|nr:TonB-dependent receptor [Gammaproteobacteria bacterium]
MNRVASSTYSLLLLALLPATARSQLPAQSGAAIEEIQVTATRRAQDKSEISAAVSLIPAAAITGQKLTTDALASQTGVFLQQTTPGQGAAILRGLKGSELLHLVDGMRLNNAIFRNAPTQYLALVAPRNVTRIEVVRGAPTSLYGSDAVGGVVQVLSRIPQFDGEDMDWRGEAHSAFDTGELGKQIGVTVESGSRAVAALLSASHLETGNRRTGSGRRLGPSGYSSSSVRAALSLTPDDSRSWLIDYQFARQPATPRVDELTAGFGETEPASAEFRFAPNERHFAHLRYMHADGYLAANWRVDLGWQRIVDDRVTRNLGSSQRRREFNSSDLFGVTVTADRDIGAGSWIAGVEYYDDTVDSQRFVTDIASGASATTTPRFPDGSGVRQGALFANFRMPLGQRNAIAAGLRLSDVSVRLPETGVSAGASIDERDLSGDLGWSFDVTPSLQLVANVGYGFRAPNVFDVGTLGERPGNRFNVPNPELKSERVTHYDAGVRFQSERARFELVLYQLHYNDRITSALTGEVTPDGRDVVQSRNQASADIRGAEMGFTWQIAANTSLDAMLNYTRGEQTDGPADRIPPLNGRATLRVDDGRISYHGSLVYAARQDRLSARDIRDVRINPTGTAGWGTLNAGVDWSASERLAIGLQIENLLDKRYRVHGSGLDAVGINVVAELTYRW